MVNEEGIRIRNKGAFNPENSKKLIIESQYTKGPEELVF